MLSIIKGKAIQLLVSTLGGMWLAFETSITFFVPCLIAILLDVWTAYQLGRRVHRKTPEKCDGKFKSEYKFRIIRTMFMIFMLIILANYVDLYILKESDLAVRYVTGIFLFYEVWSMFENWSSENKNNIARALQRIMVNKAERHLKVPLQDLFINEKDTENEKDKQNNNPL